MVCEYYIWNWNTLIFIMCTYAFVKIEYVFTFIKQIIGLKNWELGGQ